MRELIERLKRRLMYRSNGEPTLALIARMQAAKFAATRGWVIPFLTVRPGLAEKWRQAQRDDVIGYRHYLETDDADRILLDQIRLRAGPEDSLLDLGCNVGRDLNSLWQSGYRHLTGVEIGIEPVQAMRQAFPEVAKGARILNRSMAEAVSRFQDDEFALVYAHGSLVSLSAADQRVFDHMCRITRRWIITMENEWSLLLFPRDFGRVFTGRGMKQVHAQIVAKPGAEQGPVLRVFRKD